MGKEREVQNDAPLAILHLDMDAFYVNVHRLYHPDDVGIPLAVGGHPEHRGVIASASYEARQFGVRSAMPSARAMRLCPRLKIVGHDWSHIRQASHQVMAILAEYGSVEKVSVDEAYVDLSDQPEPEKLAEAIRKRVKLETGLPASVGLASSKLVAKVASDFQKPEGCTIIRPGGEADFLAPLAVRVIWGIGPRTAERLNKLGIETCGQLAAADHSHLFRHFGRQARSMQRRARGVDNRPLSTKRGPPKSISQEWTFDQDIADPELLKKRLSKMVASVARSLRKRELVAHTVKVKFRRADFVTFTRQMTVDVGLDDEQQIYNLALAVWEKYWLEARPMRLLGVGVSGLEQPSARQIGLGL